MSQKYLSKQSQGEIKRQNQMLRYVNKTKLAPTPQKKQYYSMIHNKIKMQYINHQYKNVYDKLLRIEKPEASFMHMYLQDLIFSVNKMLRQYIVHKEIYAHGNVQACIHHGKDTLQRLYSQFFLNDTIINDSKRINTKMNKQISRFFILTISFTMKLSFIYCLQSKLSIAKDLYEVGFLICLQIFSSVPLNYKLLRKSAQFLLVFACFLIDNRQIDKAINVLRQGLINETNILILIQNRMKNKSRFELRHRKIQLYNRLYAIFFNLIVCFQLKGQFHWCYLCLLQCQLIAQLKVSLLQKDIKINWYDTVKNYKKLYNQYKQVTKITQIYFDIQEIKDRIDQQKKYQLTVVYQKPQTAKKGISQNNLKSIKVVIAPENHKKRRGLIKRSVSLQNTLDQSQNKRLYKNFEQQMLFYGFDFFSKDANKNQKTISYNIQSNLATHSQMPKDYLKPQNISSINKKQSKLKKKYKKIENNLFKKISEPVQYDVLKQRVSNLWKRQEKQDNKQKEKICLLKYKSQYLNYRKKVKDEKSITEQIQIWNRKNQAFLKDKKQLNEPQQQQKQKGINLFKSLILKHTKTLDIKKSQTINILKRKTNNKSNPRGLSYSQPQQSVHYLLNKLKKQKNKIEQLTNGKIQKQIYELQAKKRKGSKIDSVFLTKNTTEIPSIFLSYISSENLLLQYGIQMEKHK